MKHLSILAFSLAIGVAAPFTAIAADDHASHKSHSSQASSASATENSVMTEGEIKKVDKGTGKVTIKHGELKNLDMAPMTMVFRVKEKTMLDNLKAGDKVSFSADKIKGQLTVTQIEVKQ